MSEKCAGIQEDPIRSELDAARIQEDTSSHMNGYNYT